MIRVRLGLLFFVTAILAGQQNVNAQGVSATVTSPTGNIPYVAGDPINVTVTFSGSWGADTYPDTVTIELWWHDWDPSGTATVPVNYANYFSSSGTATASIPLSPAQTGEYAVIVHLYKNGVQFNQVVAGRLRDDGLFGKMMA